MGWMLAIFERIAQEHIRYLSKGHVFVVGVKEVDADGAEGSADLDDFCPGEGVAQAGCQESNVHVRGRQICFRPGLCKYGKAGCAIREGHQQAAMK